MFLLFLRSRHFLNVQMSLNTRNIALQMVVLDLETDDVSKQLLVGGFAIRFLCLQRLSLDFLLEHRFYCLHDLRVHRCVLLEASRKPIINDDALVAWLRCIGIVVQRLQLFLADVARRCSAASDCLDLVVFVGKDYDFARGYPKAENVDRSSKPSCDRRAAIRNYPLVLVKHRNPLNEVHQLTLGFDDLDSIKMRLIAAPFQSIGVVAAYLSVRHGQGIQ